jgi:hypothetical protein
MLFSVFLYGARQWEHADSGGPLAQALNMHSCFVT